MQLRTIFHNLRIAFQRHESDWVSPGLFHYLRQDGDERSRLHLRIDADRTGLLFINASRVLHLNPTAAFMAYLALEKTPQQLALQRLQHLFHVSTPQITSDYLAFTAQLDELVRPDGACPIHDLDLDVTAPFSVHPTAPYRMDLALTYRCNNDCAHCYNARPRDYPELTTDQWKRILDLLWEIGIPHVVFTGGEPTLREDLPMLIRHAESNGQITGLNTNGRRLQNKNYLDNLLECGLDHVQITLESHIPAIHDQMVGRDGAWEQTVRGIKNALNSSMFVMTNTTMLVQNSGSLDGTLEFLAELGVPTIGLNALIYSGRGCSVNSGLPEQDLPPLLVLAQQHTSNHGQRLIWYTPTQYCHFDPTQLGLGVKGCTAALYNMCIEPNGDVIPCQSFYQSLGNILHSPWQAIWEHELAINLRERRFIQEKCRTCALLSECGGGCPLKMDTQTPNNQSIYKELL